MNTSYLWIALPLVVLAVLRQMPRKRRIKHPRLGLLDLTQGESAALMAEDRRALQDVFDSVVESNDAVPQCDVLLLYATIEAGGLLAGTDRCLRATIRDAGAAVVVVAAENPNPPPSPGRPVYGQANLVITLERKGAAFGRFLRDLFTQMKDGRTMPMAWVKLAPQNPHLDHQGLPATLFMCELGGIRFG